MRRDLQAALVAVLLLLSSIACASSLEDVSGISGKDILVPVAMAQDSYGVNDGASTTMAHGDESSMAGDVSTVMASEVPSGRVLFVRPAGDTDFYNDDAEFFWIGGVPWTVAHDTGRPRPPRKAALALSPSSALMTEIGGCPSCHATVAGD